MRYALLKYRDSYSSEPKTYADLVAAGLIMEDSGQCPFELGADIKRRDYAWVEGIFKEDSSSWPVAFDLRGNHPDGTRHVVFVSGHVSLLTDGEFERMWLGFQIDYSKAKGEEPTVCSQLD